MTTTATAAGGSVLSLGAVVSAEMARELAISQGVCIRPVLRRVVDRATGAVEQVALACGARREAVCPPCARKAQLLRMQQCAEGWHRTTEPNASGLVLEDDGRQVDDDSPDDQHDEEATPATDVAGRRHRSTRRRDDAAELPRVTVEDRTVGRTYQTRDGKTYRPSMFLTVTLGSYGRVLPSGAPRDPGSYDYRQAALDALHFPKLVDRLWQNLRRCAGYRVQYFAAIEPQRRLTPHLHAALRGAIPRATLRQVVAATYVQVWWPACDQPVYVDRLPIWTDTGYLDPDTGALLPTWGEALAALDDDPAAEPVHVLTFGSQVDIAGIIAPSPDADRAIRYLTKYLTKSIPAAHVDQEHAPDPGYAAHVDRLHAELRWLPCAPTCANWLRYGIQPKHPRPGLVPGECGSKAHDRDHLGLGGRRVLVSRDWSGKTLTDHRADRATVVREALTSAGIVAPDIERLAATVTLPDGTPRFIWHDDHPDPSVYVRVLLASIAERQRWRAQYEQAKTLADLSATAGRPP